MGLINRTKITTSVRNELIKKLNYLSKKTRIPKSKLHDEALELLFKKHEDIFKK